MTINPQAREDAATLDELWAAGDADEQGRSAPGPRRRWGWWVAGILVLALMASGLGYVVWAVNAPAPEPVITEGRPAVATPQPFTLATPSNDSWAIEVTGASSYIGEAGLSASALPDEARPIASITKLITALVVLDAVPLASPTDPGPTITFGKAAHDLYDDYYVAGASIVEMPTGSQLSLRDTLALTLVPSASNYADALSTWAFGSRGAFLRATARWLDAHGLTGTTIVDPTGLSPRNTSTPRDLLALAHIARAHPVVAGLTAQESVSIEGRGQFSNTNSMLGTLGVDGLKTGNLGEGRFTLLYTGELPFAPDQPLTVTGVMLDGASREWVDREVTALLRSITDGLQQISLVTAGQTVGYYETAWGASSTVVAATDASIDVWSDAEITLARETVTPARLRAGEVVETLTWTAGPAQTTVDLQLAETITPPTIWWRLTHPGLLG